MCVFWNQEERRKKGGPRVRQLALHTPPVGMDDCGATGSAMRPQNIQLGLTWVLLTLHLPSPVRAVPPTTPHWRLRRSRKPPWADRTWTALTV